MARARKQITVYRVRFVGTEDGTQEYNDNYYYDVGVGARDLPSIYATKEKASAECARLNSDYVTMSRDVSAYDGEDTPFFEYDGDDAAGCGLDYSTRIRLPWPLLWDKCLDLDIEPPIFDEDAAGNKVRPEEEPEIEELRSWWDSQINGTERKKELDEKLAPYLKLPEKYKVTTQKVSENDRVELAKAFATKTGVADNKKLQITLRDQNGNLVATYSGKASEMIAKATEFLVLHGTVQKDPGTIEFGPITKKSAKPKKG